MAAMDVLVPTYSRPTALAVTLTSVFGQAFTDYRVVLADQTEHADVADTAEVAAILRVMRAHGREVDVHKNLPRRGMAQQRQFLLDRARSPYALFLDDDVILEPTVLGRMAEAIDQEQCGFVGCAVVGLSFVDDVRLEEQAVEFWEGPVRPERVLPHMPQWQRHRLHNAANVHHLARRLGLDQRHTRRYRVAWVGGCVLYDTAKLRDAGGFGFWRSLPSEHCGEDVLAQLKVMARYGGCGLIPSGVYHQELPTTVVDRRVDAPRTLTGELPVASDAG